MTVHARARAPRTLALLMVSMLTLLGACSANVVIETESDPSGAGGGAEKPPSACSLLTPDDACCADNCILLEPDDSFAGRCQAKSDDCFVDPSLCHAGQVCLHVEKNPEGDCVKNYGLIIWDPIGVCLDACPPGMEAACHDSTRGR